MNLIILEDSVSEYFHGSSVNLEVGDYILPPLETGEISEKGRKRNLNKVFFTKDFKLARIYSGRAKNSLGGDKYVYKIKPIGDVESISPKKGATVYMADKAKIIKKHVI